jgi:group I intron endonuclease
MSENELLEALCKPTMGSFSGPGLYVIENTVAPSTADGKPAIYVGSAINMHKRWLLHLHLLRSGKHHSPHLQNAWNLYGEAAFRFMVIQVIWEKQDRLKAEQNYLDTLRPGYNIAPKATSCEGIKRTPEHIAAIKKAGAEPERRAKFLAMARSPKSVEHRAAISAAHQGKKHSEASRQSMRDAWVRRRLKASQNTTAQTTPSDPDHDLEQ